MNDLVEWDDLATKINITLPIVQFYMVYEPDGELLLLSKKINDKMELIELYRQTVNFYRWVYVDSINDSDWNLELIMPNKIYTMVRKNVY